MTLAIIRHQVVYAMLTLASLALLLYTIGAPMTEGS
jgi:hypothetical protein